MFEICSEEVWYYVSLLMYNHTLITPLSQLLCRSASIHHPSISHQSVIHPFIHLSSSVYHHSIIHQFPMIAYAAAPNPSYLRVKAESHSGQANSSSKKEKLNLNLISDELLVLLVYWFALSLFERSRTDDAVEDQRLIISLEGQRHFQD